MAAQTLEEVLFKVVNVAGTELRISFRGELRDFLAHQVMNLQKELVDQGASQEYQDVAEQVLLKFFERVMK